MRLGEKILLSLSSKPGVDFVYRNKENSENPLTLLYRVFPDNMKNIHGKEILDFGCGAGRQTVALSKNGAKYVVGMDTNLTTLKKAQLLLKDDNLKGKIEFTSDLKDSFKNRFDIIISQNSMEHFADPVHVLNIMRSLLRPEGIIIITFANPWFSPYGSHMDFFTKVPWVNILFSEKTVMNVRSRFRKDGATSYDEVESGLNKMTIAKFGRTVSECGLKIMMIKYDCVRKFNFLGKIPFLKELFVNRISCVLTPSL